MEKRIELERRARKTNQISELNLDNCRSTSIVGLTDEYTALETLSLINVGLTTLKGFPKLPNLKKLELSDNRISNGLNYLTTSPRLEYLNLSGNKIKDLETLKPLEEFKNLYVLDLFNNEATQIENYREKIFEMLPSLKFLDGFDCNDVEATSDGEDDEEVNGNGNDDDKQNVFCLNGLEIDLNELEEFEKRIQAKRKLQQSMSNNDDCCENAIVVNNSNQKIDEPDDLDEYLKELQIKENNSGGATTTTLEQQLIAKPSLSFAILLYWFLAILNLASAACYSDPIGDEEDDGDDDEDGDEDDFTDDEDNSSVSLDEVYNDDLEDDNSDWDEEGAPAEDDDDDVDSDDEDADGSKTNNESTASKTAPAAAATAGKDGKEATKEKEAVNNVAPAAAAEDKDAEAAGEESQARGKKRKHDG